MLRCGCLVQACRRPLKDGAGVGSMVRPDNRRFRLTTAGRAAAFITPDHCTIL
jgi:hypothetical protein